MTVDETAMKPVTSPWTSVDLILVFVDHAGQSVGPLSKLITFDLALKQDQVHGGPRWSTPLTCVVHGGPPWSTPCRPSVVHGPRRAPYRGARDVDEGPVGPRPQTGLEGETRQGER